MINLRAFGVVVALTLLLDANAFKLLNKRERARPKVQPKGFGTAKHAVIIGIDGFGGVYLKNVSQQLPALQSFFNSGAHTTKSRNLAPTVSAPNWAGYITSMGVTQSGIYTNYWTIADGDPPGQAAHLPPTSGRGRPQTIFSVLKEQNETLSTALFFTWPWFIQFAKQNPHIDNWFWGNEGIVCGKHETTYDCENRMDWKTQQKTIEAIKNDQPTLTFVHFDAVDDAGHKSWWGSDVYYEIVKQKDVQLAGILQALAETTTKSGKPMIEETIVAVVADHGGYRDTHGITPPFAAEIYVPLLIRGPGVKNVNMEDFGFPDVSSLDMPVTVLNALGIEKGKFMRGRVLEEIYEDV